MDENSVSLKRWFPKERNKLENMIKEALSEIMQDEIKRLMRYYNIPLKHKPKLVFRRLRWVGGKYAYRDNIIVIDASYRKVIVNVALDPNSFSVGIEQWVKSAFKVLYHEFRHFMQYYEDPKNSLAWYNRVGIPYKDRWTEIDAEDFEKSEITKREKWVNEVAERLKQLGGRGGV